MEDNNISVVSGSADVAIASEGVTPPKKKINKAKLHENLWGWAFVALLVIGTTVFVYISFIMSVMLSFTDYTGRGGTFWEALGTIHPDGAFTWYKEMFKPEVMGVGGDAQYVWGTMLSTCFYLIGIPIGMVLALFFSVLMSRDIRFSGTFRVIYYIPTVSSTVSISLMWSNLFAQGGLIAEMLDMVFLAGATTLAQRSCIIILTVWKGLGGTIVLFVAGLNGVNESHCEAADIDGANAWQIFWHIKMPQIYPTIFYVLVTSVIGGMQIYAEPALVFGDWGGAGGSIATKDNTPFVGYIYGVFNADHEWAHASALGIVLAIIIFILTLVQFALDSRRDKE